jgi:hypothetical protein
MLLHCDRVIYFDEVSFNAMSAVTVLACIQNQGETDIDFGTQLRSLSTQHLNQQISAPPTFPFNSK